MAAADPTLDGSTLSLTLQGQREMVEFADPEAAREVFSLIAAEAQHVLSTATGTAVTGGTGAGGVVQPPTSRRTLNILAEAMQQSAVFVALVTFVIALIVASHKGCGAFTGPDCAPDTHPYVIPGVLIFAVGASLSALLFAAGTLAKGLVELLDRSVAQEG